MDISNFKPMSEDQRMKMSSSELDNLDADVIQQVIQIAETHFAQAGREFKMDRKRTHYWFLFGINFSTPLVSHPRVLEDAQYLAFLRAIFAEIFDFLMYVYDGDPAYRLNEVARGFGNSILIMLLPAKAAPIIAEMENIAQSQYDADIERQNQMGY